MAVAAPVSLTPAPTPSAPGKSGVFWTQFPARSLTDRDGRPVDWTNHVSAHKAVSRLFAPRLDGPSKERRATAGILYRVDHTGGEHVVMVQSLIAPELTPQLSRTTEVSSAKWDVSDGDKVAMRLAVNPIRRYTERVEGQKPRVRTSIVSEDDWTWWLKEKLQGGFDDLNTVARYRDTTVSGKHKIVVDTVDLTATVADAEIANRIRIEGVGREKAYGCGLLTLTRIA